MNTPSTPNTPLAPLPPWLLQMMIAKKPVSAPPPPPKGNGNGNGNGHAHPYAAAALQGEMETLRYAPPGTRHSTLNLAAYKLGGYVSGGYLDQIEVERGLWEAAQACGLDRDEIARTVRDGLEAGMSAPRIIEDKQQNGTAPRLHVNGKSHAHPPQDGSTAPTPDDDSYIDQVVRVWEEAEPEPRKWVLGGWIPDGAISVMFGDGGMGKSYVALYIAQLSCLGGSFGGQPIEQCAALYLDAELEKEEFMRRSYQVARGLGLERPPRNLYYYKLRGSIAKSDVQVRVANTIRGLGVGFTVLDSLSIGAAGDNPSEAEDIIKTMTGLEAWGSVLAIDHITKAQAGTNMSYATQFGSVFKRNIARSSIRVIQAAGGGIALQHDKSNFGPKQSPLYLSTDFENQDGKLWAVRYNQVDLNDESMAGMHDHLPAMERVYEAMAVEDDGQATVTWLARVTNLSESSVKNYLTTLRKHHRVEPLGNGLWMIVQPPELRFERES